MKRNLSLLTALLFLLPVCAEAITHTGAYKSPLAPAFPGDQSPTKGCATDVDDTGACSGTEADLESPWIFDRGTVEIRSDGRVGIKLDDIQLRSDEACPFDEFPGNGQKCFCAGDVQRDCNNVGNPCPTGKGPCLPGGTDQLKVKVEIRAEGYWRPDPFWYPDPCGDNSYGECVKRSDVNKQYGNPNPDMCHKSFFFALTNTSGDINTLSASSDTVPCGDTYGPGGAVLRQILVWVDIHNHEEGTIPEWKLLARPSWKTSVNTGFTND